MDDKDSAGRDQEISIPNIKVEAVEIEENPPYAKEEVQGRADGGIEPNLGVSTHECNICCDIFASDYSLKEHISEYHHQEKTVSVKAESELKVHSRLHNGEIRYKCRFPNCEKVLSNKSNLRAHERVHNVEKPFKCSFESCEMTFKWKTSLKNHEKHHTKNVELTTCDYPGCSSEFRWKRSYQAHMKRHMDNDEASFSKKEEIYSNNRLSNCKECKKIFPNKSLLHVHKKLHCGAKPFECKIVECRKKFIFLSSLKGHLRLHDDNAPFKCTHEGCGEAFKGKGYLKSHQKLHELDANKVELKKSDDHPACSSYQGHMSGLQYRCSIHNCDASFSEKKELEEHPKSHSKEEISSKNNTFKCNGSGCKKVFPNNSLLLTHKRLYCSAKTLECKFKECSKKFMTLASLKIHLRSHDGDAPFKCTHHGCGKAFKRKDHLKIHRKLHDLEANKVELIKCDYPECSAKFRWIRSYQGHMKLHMRGSQYIYSRHNCDASFSEKEELEEHLKSHSIEEISSKNNTFKCNGSGCNEMFPNNSLLLTHKRLYCSAKTFECKFEECSKKFVSLHSLKKHLRSHDNNAPFKCTHHGCGIAFKRKDHLKIHRKLHDLEANKVELIKCDYPECSSKFRWKRSYQGHMKRHMRGSQYLCSRHNCNASFSKKEDLEDHLKSHSKEEISSNDNKPFKCTHEGCGKAFKRKDNLQTHQKLHDLEANRVELIKCHYPGCKSKFRWERSYQKHIKRHESGLKNRCTFGNCVASFVTRGELQEHAKSRKEHVNITQVFIKVESQQENNDGSFGEKALSTDEVLSNKQKTKEESIDTEGCAYEKRSHQENNDESIGEKEMSSDEVLSNKQEAKEKSIDTTQPDLQHECEAKTQQNEFKFEDIGCPKSQDSHQYDEKINVYQCFYWQDNFDEENEFNDHIESCGKYSKIENVEEGQIKPDDATLDVKSEFENIQ